MADGILGLGSSGSVDLNQELIDKLKEAESSAYLDPITESIEETQAEIDATEEIATKIADLQEIMDGFDLYTTDTNVFDEVAATTSGSSVSFSAADTANIDPGTITVDVEQLAQKDVYQSDEISSKDALIGAGSLTISVGEGDDKTDYTFEITDDMTYEDLVTSMNYKSKLNASIEQVSDDSYRFVLKSTETGLSNKISITADNEKLNFSADGNHVVEAQNFKATIDGTDYNLSSNKLTLQNGLSITAVEEGESSISIERDDTSIVDQVSQMATAYNELIDLIDSYTSGDEENAAVISDSSTLRSITSDIKDMFYDSYGLDDEEYAFSYGISFSSSGEMEVDTTVLSDAIVNNYDDVKELFVGYADKEGIGTKLSSYLDDLDSLDGTLTAFQDKLSDSLSDLNEDYEDETETIDSKYEDLATQFAAYTVIITEMENSFSSLEILMNLDDDD